MLYRSDKLRSFLYEIFVNLKDDYDFTMVICGDTGTGKSMLALSLLEEWYVNILKQKLTLDHARLMTSDIELWKKNYVDLEKFGMNIFDEAAVGLGSKQHMSKLTQEIEQLFNIFRCENYFNVLIIPSFFYLNKYFRDNRVRGLIWVDKRGQYKYYTKNQIEYINAVNQSKRLKRVNVVPAFHRNRFPDNSGILKQAYKDNKAAFVRQFKNKFLEDNKEKKPK